MHSKPLVDQIDCGITYTNPETHKIIRDNLSQSAIYNGNIEVSVMKGAQVKPGQEIGSIKKQNILSFQLWKNNTPINPEKWLIKK